MKGSKGWQARWNRTTRQAAKPPLQGNDLRAAQRAAAVNARKISGAPPANVATMQSNGVVRAFLDEDSISYSVMTRNAAGELVLQCVTGTSAVKEAISTSATTQSKGHQHDVE